jgi:hypothetical protein
LSEMASPTFVDMTGLLRKIPLPTDTAPGRCPHR